MSSINKFADVSARHPLAILQVLSVPFGDERPVSLPSAFADFTAHPGTNPFADGGFR